MLIFFQKFSFNSPFKIISKFPDFQHFFQNSYQLSLQNHSGVAERFLNNLFFHQFVVSSFQKWSRNFKPKTFWRINCTQSFSLKYFNGFFMSSIILLKFQKSFSNNAFITRRHKLKITWTLRKFYCSNSLFSPQFFWSFLSFYLKFSKNYIKMF